ncbi:class I SAM-dependent methyltransferase [Engelhardtia mirabilis]|uniref:Demethylrebeccamycin-D-glucose O-methyltransferase n=1 Tax=Engelhardtia mirabilis TaxID=2528011 RepID=A0A518BDZ1_9BACT|nr:Demethylrebeccamycin-D-glucose O-methyltransferase [Planctomycetes bacterium Pla133]QDU99530.1 Demethylrebeccamycin-D-glucose O-methyltransferase [Planctomycetes bacterium Pla86]
MHLRPSPSLLILSLIATGCAGTTPATTPLAPEASVKPGINTSYLDPDLDVDAMVARFEVESREIAASRDAIAAAVGIEPGDAVADIGAGTGLFLAPFATAVGPRGELFAVDIAAPFVEHLTQRARDEGFANVRAVLCTEDSVELPPDSIDIAFVCDTYHHFEFPRSTTTSIHTALRPGGELFIVDFERIPGVSRDWLLEHVRAGKQTVIEEITSFGFELVEEVDVAGLEENYALRFRRR